MKSMQRIGTQATMLVGTGALALAVIGAAGGAFTQGAFAAPHTPVAAAQGAPGAGTGAGFATRGAAVGRQTVATVLGMSIADIQAQRAIGKSLVQIAATKDISEDKLVAALVAAQSNRVAALVKSGTLTQAQADACTQRMTTQVRTMVETQGLPGQQGQRGGGAGMGAGMGGRGPMAGRGA